MIDIWSGRAHTDSPLCVRCNDVVVIGARYCTACGADQYENQNDPELHREANENLYQVTGELRLTWTWVLRGRQGLQLTEGKEAWTLLNRV